MCHNSGQLQKCLEHGMPSKVVRAAEHTVQRRLRQQKDADSTISKNISTTRIDLQTSSTANMEPDPTEQELKVPVACEHARKLQALRGAVGPTDEVYVDALATGTRLTRQFLQLLSGSVSRLQRNGLYTFVTKTTQMTHIIAVCVLSFVLLTVWPELIGSSGPNGASDTVPKPKNNILASIAYLGSFATHFGAQIWMTFVSGLSLYFSLPRHTFGQCQQILFPRYFALNAALSITMLILFVKYFVNSWTVPECIQLFTLSISALIEVTVRLYLAPPLLRLMHEKYKIEGAIGSGQEVGELVQGDLVKCPHYQHIHKAFRHVHMTVAIGNMIILMATCCHLYFLAVKLQINA